jgi:phospholipid/cholesterol/gamma-HCH transport system substrate-binding protein
VVQLAVFTVVSSTAFTIVGLNYARLPNLLFGANHYVVTIELTDSGGLYPRGNVTYRGTEVGQVQEVRLTDTGVAAALSLKSDIDIPSDLDAEVHSQTAVGEQYVELLPRNDTSPPLKNGDVIPSDRTSVPPDINTLLDATNRGLQAVPGDNLKTVVDEANTAFGGLGPEIARLVTGGNKLASGARSHLADLTNLADNSAPLLQTQTDTSDAVQAWAAHIANITGQLQTRDNDVAGIIRDAPGAVSEAQHLLDRVQPTLPVLLANFASIAPVLVTYQANIEQLLVLTPQGVANLQGIALADADVDSPYKGIQLNFNQNLNLPPPCTTGYLPAQQRRPTSLVDSPERPTGDLYCRIPQDSPFNVRGARNIPCETRPGKRAPTVKMCESDENYVPLNDGFNWKGDPNATLSGQDIPQLPPGAAPVGGPAASPSPIAAAEYDPATGRYVGPDGRLYTQENLGADGDQNRTWQDMLLPPQTR